MVVSYFGVFSGPDGFCLPVSVGAGDSQGAVGVPWSMEVGGACAHWSFLVLGAGPQTFGNSRVVFIHPSQPQSSSHDRPGLSPAAT